MTDLERILKAAEFDADKPLATWNVKADPYLDIGAAVQGARYENARLFSIVQALVTEVKALRVALEYISEQHKRATAAVAPGANIMGSVHVANEALEQSRERLGKI